jgi:membrane fusion protein (multidrug efflux system)
MAESAAVPPPPATRRALAGWVIKLGIVAVAAVLVALFATRWDDWVGARADQSTDDAYVRGDITPMSAKVEGYVKAVPIGDFQLVKAGQLLVEIDDEDYQARITQAEADQLGAQAAIENLKARKALQHATIEQAESAIAATRADVERTRLETARQRSLVASTFGTPQRLEQAVADEKRYEANLTRNQAELDGQHRQLAVLDTQEEQLRADFKAKRALLALAKINLDDTHIVAPVDGMVGERQVRVGQYARVGTQVITVVPLTNVWVVGNFKETQMTRVAIGQPADVAVDSFPGVVIHGKVDSISPASGSQFSLLPPDNATGNFTKVVQRIPVKIVLDPDHPLAGQLRPGMSVIATIHTDAKAAPK